jgi:hypothetical protein
MTTAGERMNKTRRPLAALTVIVMVALISGCGSSKPAETSSTAGSGTAAGSASSAGAGGPKKAAERGQAVKFAECMRGHGLSDFPDPTPSGEFVYGISVSPAVWGRILGDCKYLQPPGTLSAKRSPVQQSAALKFAQCMRENGVEDFPDPENGQPLVDTNRIPSSNVPGGMTILNATIQKCRGLMAEAARGL